MTNFSAENLIYGLVMTTPWLVLLTWLLAYKHITKRAGRNMAIFILGAAVFFSFTSHSSDVVLVRHSNFTELSHDG